MADTTDENPFKETPEDRIQHLLREEIYAYMQAHSKLEEILVEVRKNSSKLEELEETVSYFAYIPTRPLHLWYDHNKQDLYFQRNLSMHFEGKEADVISVMFRKKDGRPLKRKFYCAEVAEKFKKERRDLQTPTAVAQTIKRIQNKIDMKYRIGNIFIVTTKEFYFMRKHQSK